MKVEEPCICRQRASSLVVNDSEVKSVIDHGYLSKAICRSSNSEISIGNHYMKM